MDEILDRIKTVELTVSECVLIRNALRQYVSFISEHVKDDLYENKYCSAVVHEKVIADAIQVFGKMME